MVKLKEVNSKRGSSGKKRVRTPTHVFRGGWENGGVNGYYRLVLSCSLETNKK